MNVAPLEGSLGPDSLSALAGNAPEGSLFDGGVAPAAGDNISRFVPPWLNTGPPTLPTVRHPTTTPPYRESSAHLWACCSS